MLRKPFVYGIAGAAALAMSGFASAQVADRVSSSKKGSVLIFSKIEIRWDANMELVQDTFLDISNDYPADVHVQGYFINGDIEVEALSADDPGGPRDYEPGWNTADCRFTLTANQPHFWSAARGSNKCQPFTVLDGNGRAEPVGDPINPGGRVLRGYAIFWATRFVPQAGSTGVWTQIRWNHLKGDAVIVNYAHNMAWEYNAWAFQAVEDGVGHGQPVGRAGAINLDNVHFEAPYSELILDFYRPGSMALSVPGTTTTVQTDLTVHSASADLRQDGCGPVLTKVVAQIYNEFESGLSGTERCVCCWDQTMLQNWSSVAVNNFNTLGTDKGKANLFSSPVPPNDQSRGSCLGRDYAFHCGPTAALKRSARECPVEGREATAILALATKFISYPNRMEAAGMNVPGAGVWPRAPRPGEDPNKIVPARILYDPQVGPNELRDQGREFTPRTIGGVTKNTPVDRDNMTRLPEAPPAE